MRVYLDFGSKVAYFDATGGGLGSTTTAGHVGVAFARDYPDLLEAGWRLQFYPEEGLDGFPGEDEGEIIDLESISWYGVASAIASMIKVGLIPKCCVNCDGCKGC